MRLATVREFRDHATRMFRSREAILVTKHGHVAGLYFPNPGKSLPIELKRESLKELAFSLRSRRPTVKEEREILGEFLSARKNRR